jgi:hypothetical protein
MATVHADDSGEPGLLLAQAQDRFASEVVDGVPNYELFHFDETVLPAGTYWIQISGDAAYEASNDAENHIIWGMMSSVDPRSSATTDGTFSAGSFWTVSTGIHHFFKVIGDASP